MAVNYRTMKPAKTLSVDESEEHGPLRAYECEVCHGVSFERCTNPERLICRLCNEKAPVLESYRMALNTLGWHCSEDRRALGLGFNLGFSSFDFVRIDDDITYIDTEFEYKQASSPTWTDSPSASAMKKRNAGSLTAPTPVVTNSPPGCWPRRS